MSNLQIKLISAGVRELLKSEGIKAECAKHAKAICARCGDGYETDTYTGKTRVNASVKAKSAAAVRDNLKNNTLLKELHR